MSEPHIVAFLDAAEKLPAAVSLSIIEAELQRRADAERMTEDFYEFVKGAWHVVEPDMEFIDGMHIRAICLHLQKVTEGEIRRLLCNMPPGHAKSLIFAVLWNAWVWLRNPGWRLISASHDRDLAIRDTLRTRDLVTSSWYQDTFKPTWGLKLDQNVKSWFATTEGGFRRAASVKGKLTGHRGHCVLFDDLLDHDERFSSDARKRATDFVKKKASSRLNDKRVNPMVCVGQRLHTEDPYGELEKTGKWLTLKLPTEFNPKTRCVTPFWQDPRTAEGELLFPDLYPQEVIDEVKSDAELGSSDFAAQHNQAPVDLDGVVWLRRWWRFWSADPLTPVQRATGKWIQLPSKFDLTIASADCSFGQRDKTHGTSWTVIQTWARKAANRFLLDQVREKMAFVRMLEAIQEQRRDWPETRKTYVENKGSGSDVIDWSREKVPGLIPVNPREDKTARAHQESGPIESGNVYIPDPARYPWVKDWLDRVSNFPAKPDDETDAASQALKQLHQKQFKLRSAARSKARREAKQKAEALAS